MANEKRIYYSDFDINMQMNLLTGDIVKKTDASSIKQSLRLLFQTTYYSMKWRPQIGSYLSTLIFQQDDDYTLQLVKNEITTLVQNYEPRITINNITVKSDGNGTISIELNYKINITNVEDTFIYSINRLR